MKYNELLPKNQQLYRDQLKWLYHDKKQLNLITKHLDTKIHDEQLYLYHEISTHKNLPRINIYGHTYIGNYCKKHNLKPRPELSYTLKLADLKEVEKIKLICHETQKNIHRESDYEFFLEKHGKLIQTEKADGYTFIDNVTQHIRQTLQKQLQYAYQQLTTLQERTHNDQKLHEELTQNNPQINPEIQPTIQW